MGTFSKDLNKTYISLIPEKENLEMVNDRKVLQKYKGDIADIFQIQSKGATWSYLGYSNIDWRHSWMQDQ